MSGKKDKDKTALNSSLQCDLKRNHKWDYCVCLKWLLHTSSDGVNRVQAPSLANSVPSVLWQLLAELKLKEMVKPEG